VAAKDVKPVVIITIARGSFHAVRHEMSLACADQRTHSQFIIAS